jgi:hypothetical protein
MISVDLFRYLKRSIWKRLKNRFQLDDAILLVEREIE